MKKEEKKKEKKKEKKEKEKRRRGVGLKRLFKLKCTNVPWGASLLSFYSP